MHGMKAPLIVIATLLFLFGAFAQQSQDSSAAKPSDADVRLLEAKIRQAWEDYKNKNKEAFARILTDDIIEVEEGTTGAHDKKTTLAEIDAFNLVSYALSDFHYRPIGSNGMLVRYNVEYTAKPADETTRSNSVIGEVWEKKAGDWKLFYFQETKIQSGLALREVLGNHR